MTQRELAKGMGITESYISKLVKRKGFPVLEILCKKDPVAEAQLWISAHSTETLGSKRKTKPEVLPSSPGMTKEVLPMSSTALLDKHALKGKEKKTEGLYPIRPPAVELEFDKNATGLVHAVHRSFETEAMIGHLLKKALAENNMVMVLNLLKQHTQAVSAVADAQKQKTNYLEQVERLVDITVAKQKVGATLNPLFSKLGTLHLTLASTLPIPIAQRADAQVIIKRIIDNIILEAKMQMEKIDDRT